MANKMPQMGETLMWSATDMGGGQGIDFFSDLVFVKTCSSITSGTLLAPRAPNYRAFRNPFFVFVRIADDGSEWPLVPKDGHVFAFVLFMIICRYRPTNWLSVFISLIVD